MLHTFSYIWVIWKVNSKLFSYIGIDFGRIDVDRTQPDMDGRVQYHPGLPCCQSPAKGVVMEYLARIGKGYVKVFF